MPTAHPIADQIAENPVASASPGSPIRSHALSPLARDPRAEPASREQEVGERLRVAERDEAHDDDDQEVADESEEDRVHVLAPLSRSDEEDHGEDQEDSRRGDDPDDR